MFAVSVLAPAYVSPTISLLATAGLAIAILAHRRRSKRRIPLAIVRLALALLLTVSVATVAHAAEDDPGVVIVSQCEGLTPWDWQWWVSNCGHLPILI